jgi:mono/diheme cytochrome c family protein
MWRVVCGMRRVVRGAVCCLIFAVTLAAWLTRAEPVGEAVNGKELYLERCVLCHGAAGRGWDWSQKAVRPPVPVPNLVEVVPQRSDDYLMAVIRDGGEAVGLTRFMPAFGFNMSEQELRDVVAYLRSLPRRAR